MRIRHLRVRIKELASEAKHIRHEERQVSGFVKWELQHHRRTVVRPAARYYLLAYGYGRGVPYKRMEATVREHNQPALGRLKKIVTKFGGDPEGLESWLRGEAAKRDAPQSQNGTVLAV